MSERTIQSWVTVVAIFASACAAHGDSESVGSSSAALGGVADDQDLFNSNVVVDLQTNEPGSATVCSGMMISPTRVLTASHCEVDIVPAATALNIGSVRDGTTFSLGTIPTVDSVSELGHATDPNNAPD